MEKDVPRTLSFQCLAKRLPISPVGLESPREERQERQGVRLKQLVMEHRRLVKDNWFHPNESRKDSSSWMALAKCH